MKNINYLFNQEIKGLKFAKKHFYSFLFIILLLVFSNKIAAQTTVFFDDFNRGSVAIPLANGGIPTMIYSTTTTSTGSGVGTAGATSTNKLISGSDYTANIVPAWSQATPTPQTNGRTYVYAPLSSYSSGFNTTLSNNTGDITWTFNMRSPRAGNLNTGFVDGKWGYACVLAATSSNFLTANGYAITEVAGTSTTGNAISLVKFANGLLAPTTIIGPSADNAFTKNFFSIKVVYTPLTNTWKLFVRDDLSETVKGDPTTTTTQVGAVDGVVDDTYTSTVMSHFGFFANHGTANNAGVAGTVAAFDDFKVTVAASNVTGLIVNSLKYRINVVGKVLGFSEKGTVEVYNMQGTQLFKAHNVNKLNTNLSAGLYIVRFSNNGQQFIQKVTIQ